MNTEIEAKFLNVDFDEIRKKLKSVGAKLEHPMRTMSRVLFDYPDDRFQKDGQRQRLRLRDEGDRIMLNYKIKNGTNYVNELEVAVGSFDDAAEILKAIGLKIYSFQESKRETWKYKDVEVVLDEWPWLDTYIEIEGPSEEAIKEAAHELGFKWSDARYGSVDTAYMNQYPGMTKADSVSDVGEVHFGDPLPDYFKKRMKK